MRLRERIRQLPSISPGVQNLCGLYYMLDAVPKFVTYAATKDPTLLYGIVDDALFGVAHAFVSLLSVGISRSHGYSIKHPFINKLGTAMNGGLALLSGIKSISNPSFISPLESFGLMTMLHGAEYLMRRPTDMKNYLGYPTNLDEALDKVRKIGPEIDEDKVAEAVCFTVAKSFNEKSGENIDREMRLVYDDALQAVRDIRGDPPAQNTFHLDRLRALEEGRKMYSIEV